MTTGWASRPTDLGRPGHADTDLERLKLLDAVAALMGPGWTDYTTAAPSGGTAFSLSAVTTPPTQGNSTYLARYKRPINEGDEIKVEFYILIGGTFSAGSGVYRFGLPFNASASSILCSTGTARILDTGTAERTAAVKLGSATWVELVINGAASAITSAGSGTAWAAGDIIQASIVYEPA